MSVAANTNIIGRDGHHEDSFENLLIKSEMMVTSSRAAAVWNQRGVDSKSGEMEGGLFVLRLEKLIDKRVLLGNCSPSSPVSFFYAPLIPSRPLLSSLSQVQLQILEASSLFRDDGHLFCAAT